MATQPQQTRTASASGTTSDAVVPRASTWAVWGLFVLSAVVLGTSWGGHEWGTAGVVTVDGLTALLWVVVAFFAGIVQSYSRRYMAGDRRHARFHVRVLGFTVAVMAMAAANHVALLVAAWLSMGLVMASLIGHERQWPQARAAERTARRYFLASGISLAVGAGILAWETGSGTVSGIGQHAGELSGAFTLVAVGALVLAALLQSALFPFHTWLLSSMTAPTPASALMHAGFVNAGGVLLTRFAPLFAGRETAMAVVVAFGATSALLGQALLQVQPDVKRELGVSTVAQMGFMVLQCGLGFFAAAIAHLVLHGFYKAYLFLSAGANVERTVPQRNKGPRGTATRLAAGVVTATAGAALFAALTGKGTAPNSGVLLAFVVALTTLHAARDVLRRSALPPLARAVGVPLVTFVAIGTYGVLFNAVEAALAGVPMVSAPTELNALHLVVAGAFTLAYLSDELGWHRRSKRLYVALVNLSQPASETVLTRKGNYDDI